MKRFLFIASLIFFVTKAFSQSVGDSSIFVPMFNLGLSFQIPQGDLADRFGNSMSVAPSFRFKTANNLFFDIEGQYLFSEKVKEDDIFSNFAESESRIVNMYGEYARIVLLQRGFIIQGRAGAMVYKLGPNPNCGFYLLGGAGFIQHKIRIDVDGNDVPQLSEEYKKGYDKLTNGFAISETIGYIYLDNRGRINFFVELEFFQSWTQSRRDYDFTYLQKDEKNRNDYLIGLKVGWILPFHKRVPDKYYYY